MKKFISTLLVIFALFVNSCSQPPAEGAIQTAIEETQAAKPKNTFTPEYTLVSPPADLSLMADVPASTDPRLFVLTIQDIPQGYQMALSQSGYSSNQSVAESRDNPDEFLSKLETWGRVNGYLAVYLKGDNWIRSNAIILKTHEGAHEYFTDISSENLQEGWTQISAPTIGEEAFAFTRIGITGQQTEIGFRKRNVLALINLSGRVNNIEFDDLIRFTEKMASRIVDNPTDTGLAMLPDKTPMTLPTAAPFELPTIAPSSTPVMVVKSIEQTQTLGPIWNSTRDENFSVIVDVHKVISSSGSGWDTPKEGFVFVSVDVTVTNLGPDPIRSIGPYDFQMSDANGALRDTDYISEFSDCDLDLVDLSPNGSISGCVSFEVPDTGSLELIYAPYKYEGLEPGRYLSFVIR